MSRTTDHVDAFNHAVTTGDWDTFAERFAEDATMTFIGVPAGSFHGRRSIASAYRENPPTETMTIQEADGDSIRFRWASGGTGTMKIGWTPAGAVQTLTVSFDP
ncbi:SnoaL-like protein [Kribbella antiqua]|uniref:SnoaL-like protein n=1 Tax=Kribbella antiqua TaxID=2512217 RepID=A0A4R2ICB5_9ACTN|nr:nuclear transport factor 2 family protein [Kribbella antiqua]TCO42191.1 SnoaL-like protein [Kribbella antiqua]